jgi:anaerobic selenocysteine-containing dehydrogenase
MRLPTDTTLSRRSFLFGGTALGALAGLELNPIAKAIAAERIAHSPGSGEWIPTVCAGCTSFCTKQIYVQDGRVLHIRGNEYSKVHGKAGCVRQYLSLPELYDPDRVKTPLKRTNPKKGRDQDPGFVPITWDEAMGMLADRLLALRQKGEPHKFVTLRGRYSNISDIMLKDIPAILGSGNAITHSALCAETDKFGPYYLEGFWGYRQYDLENTRHQLLFGADPITSNRQVSYYAAAWGDMLDRARVTVVAPQMSSAATKADEWLPIVPGQDAALAVALAHTLLVSGLWYRPFVGDFTDKANRFKAGETVDEALFAENHTQGLVKWWNLELKDRTPEWAEPLTGVSATQIRRLAQQLGGAAPKVGIWMSRGMHMQTRGAYNSMAVHALAGLLGAADSQGGSMPYQSTPSNKSPKLDDYQDDIAKAGVKKEKIDRRGRLELPALASGKPGGGVVTNQVADSILEADPYDVQVILAYWANFTFSAPQPQRWEAALSKVPFVAHLTTNLSELSWYSDLILPAGHHMYERYGWSDVGGNGYKQAGIQQPMVKPMGDYVADETGVPWLLAQALDARGFPAPLSYLKKEFKDPETGKEPTNQDEFGLYALKRATQPMWDPAQYKDGDRFEGWDHFRKVGVWNSSKYKYQSRWSKMKTKTGKFEFYSETLKDALTAHAEKHKVGTDAVLEKCDYTARGELAFVPHYEPPQRIGDAAEYPLLFVDVKSRITREGRGTNSPWFQALKDVDMGEEKYRDVAKLNPVDARRLGIQDGDTIRLTTVAGSITCNARLWEGTQPGTVVKSFGQGHWAYGRYSAKEFGKTPRGGNNNEILPALYDRLSGSSVYYGQIGVRVEKV